MKYRYMGTSGLLVSRVCLGTMTFGAEGWGCDEETSARIVRRFLEAGGNFLDTADIYAGGRSEEFLGRAIKGVNRDSLVVATKGYFRTGTGPTDRGNSRKHLIAACEASLRRLGLEYIDLYYIHGPDPHTPWDETMRALDDLVRHGKVRYLGCSNLEAWELVKANATAERRDLERFVCGQYMYNLVHREVELSVLPACEVEGAGFAAWSPLAGGLLAGKYRRSDKPDEGTRIAYREKIDGPRFWHERGFETADTARAVAERSGIPTAKLSLAWPLSDRRVTSVIIGVRNEDQLASNLEIGEWDLPEEIARELSEKTEFDRGWLAQFRAHAFRSNFGDEEKPYGSR